RAGGRDRDHPRRQGSEDLGARPPARGRTRHDPISECEKTGYRDSPGREIRKSSRAGVSSPLEMLVSLRPDPRFTRPAGSMTPKTGDFGTPTLLSSDLHVEVEPLRDEDIAVAHVRGTLDRFSGPHLKELLVRAVESGT